jgi:hypothetical protein
MPIALAQIGPALLPGEGRCLACCWLAPPGVPVDVATRRHSDKFRHPTMYRPAPDTEPKRPAGSESVNDASPSGDAVQQRADVITDAHALALVHVRGVDDLCVGCLDHASFAIAPCPYARRALSVIETHGAFSWDELPSRQTISLRRPVSPSGRSLVRGRSTNAHGDDYPVWTVLAS